MKRGLVLTAALVLILVFAFRWWLPAERATLPSISLPDTRLDYSLKDFEASFYDEQGRPDLMIQGPDLQHDAERRVVTLIQPRFQLSSDALPWLGTADGGEFDRNFDTLKLRDNVELWQDQPNGRLTLNTEALQHLRAARTITADVPVQLTSPGTLVDAGGLIIDLDSETVELNDKIHLHAQPAEANR